MRRTIEILSPLAPVRAGDHPLADRPASLSGLRVGLLDNNKPNAGVLLGRLGELLGRAGGPLRLVPWKKANPAVPETRLEEFIARVDVVVSAVGD